jgi:hypothetical protein
MNPICEYDIIVTWMRQRGVTEFCNNSLVIKLGPEPKASHEEQPPEKTAEQLHAESLRSRRATVEKLFAATSMRPVVR